MFQEVEGPGEGLAGVVVSVGRAGASRAKRARAAQRGSSAARPLSSATARASAAVWRSHLFWA
ncbi:hypothetical protein TU94_00555 [Streptomyces cyaneogriseus subsp. noncyanogenus]|uniref:Uncharacterized protein n=1 Tax=Streptomyces cyaneogriseus subsp. noncyanogenus TaxID=477245 RepID=A0A0C5FWV3_9ACTN|nr:hypothetical protein TU94_00555 [Streptomyces cyaneogriseus subsp. noncyanogenus]